jgi:hypothetical protein
MGQSEDQKNHLRAAVAAAARHDACDYITELAASHVLDGLTRSLTFHWPKLDEATLEEVVSEAAEALYAKVTEGGIVREPAGFLWGTASNLLKERRRQGRLDTEQFDNDSVEHNAAGDDIQEQPERDRAAMRAMALRAHAWISIDSPRCPKTERLDGGAGSQQCSQSNIAASNELAMIFALSCDAGQR